MGRYINADDVEFFGASETSLGYNSFAYCENNPVNNSDSSGYLAATLISALIGGTFSALVEYITSAGIYYLTHNLSLQGFKFNSWSLIWAFATGFASGALMISSLKVGSQTAISGIIGLISGIIDEAQRAKIERRRFDAMYPIATTIIGLISGLIAGGGLGKGFKWTRSLWYVGGRAYYSPPVKLLATKQFATSLARYISSCLFGQISKSLPNYL